MCFHSQKLWHCLVYTVSGNPPQLAMETSRGSCAAVSLRQAKGPTVDVEVHNQEQTLFIEAAIRCTVMQGLGWRMGVEESKHPQDAACLQLGATLVWRTHPTQLQTKGKKGTTPERHALQQDVMRVDSTWDAKAWCNSWQGMLCGSDWRAWDTIERDTDSQQHRTGGFCM
jgi:hypothetical protein